MGCGVGGRVSRCGMEKKKKNVRGLPPLAPFPPLAAPGQHLMLMHNAAPPRWGAADGPQPRMPARVPIGRPPSFPLSALLHQTLTHHFPLQLLVAHGGGQVHVGGGRRDVLWRGEGKGGRMRGRRAHKNVARVSRPRPTARRRPRPPPPAECACACVRVSTAASPPPTQLALPPPYSAACAAGGIRDAAASAHCADRKNGMVSLRGGTARRGRTGKGGSRRRKREGVVVSFSRRLVFTFSQKQTDTHQ